MQRNSALAPANQCSYAEILNYQGVRLQDFIKIKGFFEQFKFVLKHNRVERYVKFFAKGLGYTSGPAQAFFVEIASKSPRAKALASQVNGICTGQTGCFETGGSAGRSEKLNFFARTGQELLSFEQPLKGNTVNVGTETHDHAFTDRAQQ